MPTMNDIIMTNDTSNNRWKVSYTVDEANIKSKILNTAGTFVDRDIQVEITTPEATFNTVNGAVIVDQGGFVDAGTTVGSSSNPATVTSGNANIEQLNFVYNDSNDNFNISGTSTVSAPIVNTQGYISSIIGTKNTGTATVAATTAVIGGTTNITGTLTKTPTITLQSLPSGVVNGADGNASTSTPTTGAYIAVRSGSSTSTITASSQITTSGYGTSTHHNLTSATATVGANASAITYVKIKDTSINYGTTAVNGTDISRGIASWDAGWLNAGTLNAATFTNTGISGTTYIDISNTTAAPVLVSEDYLYINKGYTDNLKISLAKLIPNDATITGNAQYSSSQMLSGYTAYDKDGKLFTGNIPTRTDQNISINGDNITVQNGYYNTNYTVSISEGDYSADDVSDDRINSIITPSINLTNNASGASASTYGFSNSQPSSGLYFTLTPNMTATDWSITPRANIIRAGYLELGNKIGTTITGTPTIASTLSNYYIPIRTINISGGELSISNDTNTITTNPTVRITESGSFFTNSNYGITTTKPTGTDNVNYLTIHESHSTTNGLATSSWSAQKTATIYNNLAGLVEAHTNTQGLAAATQTGGATASISVTYEDNFEPYYIPIVTPSFSGGTLTATVTAGAETSENITPSPTVTNYYIDAIANGFANRSAVSYSGIYRGAISKNNGDGTNIQETTVNADEDIVRVYLKEATLQAVASGVGSTGDINAGDITIRKKTQAVNSKVQLDITPTTSTSGISTYYLALDANVAASNSQTVPITGTIKAKVINEGYLTDTAEASTNLSGNANISVKEKTSSTFYLPLPTVSGSWSNDSNINGTATANINNVNNISTITNISGKTAGQDYWTITPTISTTAAKYTPKYIVTEAQRGWLHNNLTDTERTISVTGTVGNNLYIPKASWSTVGGTTTINTAGYLPANTIVTNLTTVTPVFDGGDLTVDSNIVGTNVTLSTTNNGIYIDSTGTASRAAVLYNGAVNGYVNVEDNTQALASGNISQTSATRRYITAITVPKDKAFSLTTTADTALDTTSNVTIVNNAYRQLTITNKGTASISNTGDSIITSNSSTSGQVKINAYNDASTTALTGEKTIVSNGKWVYTTVTPTTTTKQGPYFGAVYVNPMSSGTAAQVTISGSKAATTPTVAQVNTAGTGSAVNIYSSNQASTDKPSSGYFVAVQATAPATTINLTKTLNTAGYLGTTDNITASASTTSSNNTYYVTIPTAQFTTDGNKIVCETGGYIAKDSNAGTIGAGAITNNTTLPSGSSSTGTINRGKYIKIGAGYYGNDIYYLAQNNSGTITITGSGNTTVNGYVTASVAASSMSQGTTTVSETTATRGTASWGSGWITAGSLAAATFKNTATSGTTYIDISNTTEAPILTSNGYLYINKGYTDNLRISLAKLIPNDANVTASNQLLNGYSAYDKDGKLITGNISSKAAATYYPSTSDQTIAAGQYLSGTQTIKAVTLTNLNAANIKYGTTVKIGDSADDDRIIAVTGTFTGSSTVSSGQTAAAAAQIRSGYSAWVNGAEVKGSMGQATATITGTNTVTATASLSSDANNTSVLSTANNSGIAISATGGGTASVIAKATTNTVGYSGAAGTQLGTATLSSGTDATTITTTKYLKEVTLVPPSSGTREFGIKVPNGEGEYITWVFHVDSSGNVTIDDTYNLTY